MEKFDLQFFGGRGGGSGKGGKSGGGGASKAGGKSSGRTYEQRKEDYNKAFLKYRDAKGKEDAARRELIHLQHSNAPSQQIIKHQQKVQRLTKESNKYMERMNKALEG